MIGSAALHKAIVAAWSAAGLDAKFNTYWTTDSQSRYPVLNDTDATPGQEFPYCVYEIDDAPITVRMSGIDPDNTNIKQAIRDVPLHFMIYTKIDSDSETAKELAADLMEEVTKVFGGHPDTSPDGLTLDSGEHVITQYENDNAERQGDEEWQWTIDYIVKLDVPLAV